MAPISMTLGELENGTR